MLINIRYKEVKVRRPNSHLFNGEEKFTGTVTYSVIGSVDREPVRLSLGTEEKGAAIRRVSKIEKACAEGSKSSLWHELEESLPTKTFKFFADRAGYVGSTKTPSSITPTWGSLCDAFEIEMTRCIANKKRGASRKEGTMSESTRDRYRQTIRHFTSFLGDKNLPLAEIQKSTIAMFKVDRQKKIEQLKQSRGGSSIALDVVVLHRMFAFAVSEGLMLQKPISLKNESKPGENPQNGARSFTADELTKLREAADLVNNGGKLRKPETKLEKELRKTTGGDLFIFLVLRWTGLRASDAINLRWQNIHFDRGVNGEVEVLTQKRNKLAIIPLSTELRNALEELYQGRKPRLDDRVLFNPENGRPFDSRKRLYERIKALGIRAEVERVTPHCFRDTFACDMLARGEDIYSIAKMLADTVDTIEKHYAQFIPAARDAAQHKMDSGIGIEERAKLAQQRGRKVAVFPG
jgi:integrase